jgi:U3 small nucleolar RNA-associated protein 21
MLGSAEDEGLFEGSLQLHVINIMFPVLDDLSALVVYDQPEDNFVSMLGLEGEVVTLTHLPRSRWQTLLNLDVIQVSCLPFSVFSYAFTHLGNQQRNKPKEPPKAPEKAPFFLPTLAGVEARFVVQEKEKEETSAKKSQKAPAHAESVFFQKLLQGPEDGNCECTSTFKGAGSSSR